MQRLINILTSSGRNTEEISQISDVPRERVIEILSGQDPTLGELRKLSKAFGLKLLDILETNEESANEIDLLFRNSQPEQDFESEKWTIHSFSRRIADSLSLLSCTDELPNWLADFPVVSHTLRGAEEAAAEARRQFFDNDQRSPLLGLPRLIAERLNVIVFVSPKQDVDGASALYSGHAFIFVAPRFPPRMLFTVAHELAHLLAHHSTNEPFAYLDKEGQVGNYRRKMRSKKEAFADAFASALLMPPKGVGTALRMIRQYTKATSDEVGDIEILYLSRIFGVSFQAAAYRCELLDLLPKGGGESLYQTLRKNHGSPEKRAEELGLPERPNVEFPAFPPTLLNAAILAVEQGRMSINKVSEYLDITVYEFMKAKATYA